MKITTKAHYGLMAMCELARQYDADPIPARELAGLQNCSHSYMEQLFALLKKNDLIKSTRGAYGGYKLSRSPEEISIAEIIRALEGPIGFTDCSMEDNSGECCQLDDSCSSKIFWQELTQNVNSFLEQKKLADLINRGDLSEKNIPG